MSVFVKSGLVRYHEDLNDLMVDIDTVRQHPENANNGATDEIIASIETNGMYRPVYVQRATGFILSGNHTWEACKSLGATKIPVVYVDCDDLGAKRIMVADNAIASLAIPDPALMVDLLDQIAATEDGLLGTGVSEQEHEQLRELAKSALDSADFAMWPMIQIRVPPHVRRAFYYLTDEADGDTARFELVLRLAGWDGHDVR